jgi:hypothetical protein
MAGKRLVILGVSALLVGLGATAEAATPHSAKSAAIPPPLAQYRCPDDYRPDFSPDIDGGVQNFPGETTGAAFFVGEYAFAPETVAGVCVKADGKHESVTMQAQDAAGAGAVVSVNEGPNSGVYWNGGTQVCYITNGNFHCV